MINAGLMNKFMAKIKIRMIYCELKRREPGSRSCTILLFVYTMYEMSNVGNFSICILGQNFDIS